MLHIKSYKEDKSIRKDVKPLFLSAFPRDERPPVSIFFRSFKKEVCDLYAFYDQDIFIGFISTISYLDYIYIFFLAVDEKQRNKGYGSKMLEQIKDLFKDKVLALCYEEVDEKYPDNELRKKRREFYHRNGFVDNDFKTYEFGVIFQTCYLGDHKYSFKDYQQFFKVGFGEFALKYLKEIEQKKLE